MLLPLQTQNSPSPTTHSTKKHIQCLLRVKNKSPLWHLLRAAASFQMLCGIWQYPRLERQWKEFWGDRKPPVVRCTWTAWTKNSHLIEWMLQDNEHNKINGLVKQCQLMSPGSDLDPLPLTAWLGFLVLSVISHFIDISIMLQFPQPWMNIYQFLGPPHTLLMLKRYSEWILWIFANSQCLDGLPMQFFKTHFTYTTGAIKDPQRTLAYRSVYTLHW